MRRKLCRELNKLCEKLDYKYNINVGGCCYISALIAKYLDKLNIPYELMISSWDSKNINDIQEEVKFKKQHYEENNSVTGYNNCSHYWINLKNVGSINGPSIKRYEYRIKDINASNIMWIYRKSEWNDHYDTNYNSCIGKIIKQFFKEYENL